MPKDFAPQVGAVLRIFGQRVRHARQQRKISRSRFSEEVGISVYRLALIESGAYNVDVVSISRISEALNISPSSLISSKLGPNALSLQTMKLIRSFVRN